MIFNDKDDAVSALVEQVHGLTDSRCRVDGDRGVESSMRIFDAPNGPGDEICWDILGQNRNASAPGDGLCHATSGNCGHIGHYEGQRST